MYNWHRIQTQRIYYKAHFGYDTSISSVQDIVGNVLHYYLLVF